MNGDSVDLRIVDEPDAEEGIARQCHPRRRKARGDSHLVTEQLRVVLRVEVRLGRLGGVELETLPDTLTEDVERRVGLHDLRHRLLDERLHSGRPVTVRGVQVVAEIDCDEDSSSVDEDVSRGTRR